MATPLAPRGNLGQRLQGLPKPVIYLILILVCTIPQFFTIPIFTIPIPNQPDDSSVKFYSTLMALPEGSRVLVASDWTGSTRGESKGQFLALLKLLMERKIKFALYSTADPQAPQAAIDTIRQLNAQRRIDGKPEYQRWTDWVNVGYFADSEAATNGIANDLTTTFKSKKDTPPGGSSESVLQSPVFQRVQSVRDFQALIVITASKTSNITIERVSGKIPLAFMVTGVMGPESRVFFQSNQVVGLAVGLKGAFDLEQLDKYGVNNPGTNEIKSTIVSGSVPPVVPDDPPGQGTRFYPTLHFALALMIFMVVLGNVGMFLARRGGRP
ncbi:hypothetical protein EON77_02605 [bacterium]|nr:MAG: hypothetical protein EON77_02605 [bacterium]